MPTSPRNVLAVGLSSGEFQHLLPFLDRQPFEVDRFPSATGALELISHVPFEVLFVRYPLPGLDMTTFLDTVRQPDLPSLRASLLILTTEGDADGAKAFVGKGANRVIDMGASEDEILGLISSVLHVAPRKAARFLARIEVRLGGAKDMILCQTENISASGMLIRTDRRYDLGTEIDFEFNLPNDPRPIRGVAEIVRHTVDHRDQVDGIGLRFVSFAGDAGTRFETYLARL